MTGITDILNVGIPIAIGAAIPIMGQMIKNSGKFYIAEIYREQNGEYFLVKRKHVGLLHTSFNFGERQYLIDSEQVIYNEGIHPIIQYDLESMKPLKKLVGKAPDKPTSASANMWFRRQGIKQMIQATKTISSKEMIIYIIIGLAIGLSVGYGVFQYWHPGLYPSPPPGYYYKAEPIPTNATRVGGGGS